MPALSKTKKSDSDSPKKRKREDVEDDASDAEGSPVAEAKAKESRREAKEKEKEGKRKRKGKDKEREEVGLGEATKDASEGGAAEDEDAGEDEEEDEEVEVLSRKALRKKRKLESKGVDPSGSENQSSEQTTKKGTAEKAEDPEKSHDRTPFGIWVGNLSFSTTVESLKAFLLNRLEGLKESEVKRINMPGGRPGKKNEHNRGFAYVDFSTQELADKAIKLSEDHLDGRRLLIKSSKDFSGRPEPAAAAVLAPTVAATVVASTNSESVTKADVPDAAKGKGNAKGDGKEPRSMSKTARKILSRQKNPACPTLFLGNLGFETTEPNIKQLFDAHYRATQRWERKNKAIKKNKDEKTKLIKAKGALKGKDSGSDEDDEVEKDEDESEGEQSEDGDASDDGEDEDDEEEEIKGNAGIRKVRMGTFQDTGKCKGFVFVDFLSPQQAMAALINPRNHQLDGRKLVVEFASADAVRRGGGVVPASKKGGKETTNADGGGGNKRRRPDERPQFGQQGEGGQARSRPPKRSRTDLPRDTETQAEYDQPVPERKTERERRPGPPGGKVTGKRLKPGAALANAPREKVGIVKSEGKKIVFD